MLAAIVVTLLQFSDYHSHAVPFYAEEGADRGGIARAAGYLAAEKKRGALIFRDGDEVIGKLLPLFRRNRGTGFDASQVGMQAAQVWRLRRRIRNRGRLGRRR